MQHNKFNKMKIIRIKYMIKLKKKESVRTISIARL